MLWEFIKGALKGLLWFIIIVFFVIPWILVSLFDDHSSSISGVSAGDFFGNVIAFIVLVAAISMEILLAAPFAETMDDMVSFAVSAIVLSIIPVIVMLVWHGKFWVVVPMAVVWIACMAYCLLKNRAVHKTTAAKDRAELMRPLGRDAKPMAQSVGDETTGKSADPDRVKMQRSIPVTGPKTI